MVKKFNAIQATDISNLVKKTDFNIKINEIKKKSDHDHSNKYITKQEFNNLTSEHFAARLAQENLAIKTDIVALVKKGRF